jgi:hypothetical protein
MENKNIGVYPGGTNPIFIHLTGTIVSWWARTEGIMIGDITTLRTQSFSAEISQNSKFPTGTGDTIKHWAKLLLNAYGNESEACENIKTAKTEALEILFHRDRLVHSFWPFGQIDPEILNLNYIKPDKTMQHGVFFGEYSMTINELDAVNRRFAALYHAVMAISFNSHRLYPR